MAAARTTTIDAPGLGQRMTFEDDHGRDELRFIALLQPGAFTPPHRHLTQHERFEIESGSLTALAGRRLVTRAPGETVTFVPGQLHAFRNRTQAPVRARVTIWPALETRALFETLFALDAAGRLNRAGAPDPLRSGLLIERFGRSMPIVWPLPPAVQARAGRALAAIARRRGVRLDAATR